ncbi:MAG: aminomethyl-transferring glycine dehydrogenase subunit GcvPA [Candidatus Eisenbacteria bacterium]|nr:aminomethyl-transferring glycine dehydrogenase subunit GcvPA [Candidatus Eisenbacteria bacterium]
MAGYIGRSEKERQEMLGAAGVDSVEELLRAVPAELRKRAGIDLDPGMSEMEVSARLAETASRDLSGHDAVCFAGAGVYDHYVPAAVKHLLLRSEFYTCYTPYQAEVSQGTLQCIFEFQSLICRLTGMDVCNASMYDGATAVAEAALLAVAARETPRVLVSACVHPHHREVLKTYCAASGIEVVEIVSREGVTDVDALKSALRTGAACFIHQQPNFYGIVEDASEFGKLRTENPAMLISCVDPVSLALLEPPSAYGADVVVGEGQAFGNPMNFGGPLLGFFAVRNEHVRRLPGRVVGMTVDGAGKRGFVLTLQTREQHIRRAKATSNICTNEALVALAATIHLALLGGKGLKTAAEHCLAKSHYAAEKMSKAHGFELKHKKPFFKEFLLSCPVSAEALVAEVAKKGILAGVPLSRFALPEETDSHRLLLVAVTEKRTANEIDRLWKALGEAAATMRKVD